MFMKNNGIIRNLNTFSFAYSHFASPRRVPSMRPPPGMDTDLRTDILLR